MVFVSIRQNKFFKHLRRIPYRPKPLTLSQRFFKFRKALKKAHINEAIHLASHVKTKATVNSMRIKTTKARRALEKLERFIEDHEEKRLDAKIMMLKKQMRKKIPGEIGAGYLIRKERLRLHIEEAKEKQREAINYSIFQSPPRPSLPIEVFYDVLKFLPRNELEKCQLISRSWNHLILFNPNVLPLRHIYQLRGDAREFSVDQWHYGYYQNTKGRLVYKELSMPKEIAVHGFKNTIITEFTMGVSDKAYEKFKNWFRNNEEKWMVRRVKFVFSIKERYLETFENLMTACKNILLEFNKVNKIELNLSENFKWLLANPKILEFLSTYPEVVLNGDLKDRCWCKLLPEFLTCLNQNFIVKIQPTYCHSKLMKNIIDRFMNPCIFLVLADDKILGVTKFPRKVRIEGSLKYRADMVKVLETKQILPESSKKSIDIDRENVMELSIVRYSLARKDGWYMDVILIEDFPDASENLVLYFSKIQCY